MCPITIAAEKIAAAMIAAEKNETTRLRIRVRRDHL
jgi:hypothetical protein